MATHSSIPAWRIPWTEEAGGLQSTGSQRVKLKGLSTHTDRQLVPEWLCWHSGESHSIPLFPEIVIGWEKLAYSVPGVFGQLWAVGRWGECLLDQGTVIIVVFFHYCHF